jgi:hypothetical protein
MSVNAMISLHVTGPQRAEEVEVIATQYNKAEVEEGIIVSDNVKEEVEE